ncbi:Small, acid-soluble spore protein, alpha/beta type [Sporobacter termitidis DSM 10068]|uniref:Small, acid-soluble spore protein, alpha/beta type n=1 Tax=Sporobacter termitidis DSM 10068 TaxID=1123282 RepID=A0A1M5Z1E6_9FIRM|nr:alpha/beta-type small acid-soluble spore protein [Sporobacter termitidis]SHI18076.1 Small, acid-soluble spore protein, alpha/beta type [Sporobacter termitidis DSM 10068]
MARNNQLLNPKARGALNRLKMETANEVGVKLNEGYNGDIKSKDAGQIGGNMVKKMVQSYEDKATGSTSSTGSNS